MIDLCEHMGKYQICASNHGHEIIHCETISIEDQNKNIKVIFTRNSMARKFANHTTHMIDGDQVVPEHSYIITNVCLCLCTDNNSKHSPLSSNR